jgi:hypothetical protein
MSGEMADEVLVLEGGRTQRFYTIVSPVNDINRVWFFDDIPKRVIQALPLCAKYSVQKLPRMHPETIKTKPSLLGIRSLNVSCTQFYT